MAIIYLILAIILFIGLVVVHEFGHFIAARRGGVEVEEFGIGFPPKLYGKKIKTKKSKFLFTINLLPLGGFVRLKGESDSDKRPGSFGAASLTTKVKIMTAGVAMNAVIAVGLFTLLALIGIPQIVDNQFKVASDSKVVKQIENPNSVLVASVGDNTPAAKAGLQPEDRIVNLAGTEITSTQMVGEVAKNNAGKEVPITVQRGDQTIGYKVSLNAENKGDGYLGIASKSGAKGQELRRSTWSAPIVGLGTTVQVTELTIKGLGTVISSLARGDGQTAKEQVVGPVGIAVVLNAVSQSGINSTLMVIAIISITLAIMNILPIPALDGGRLFTTLYSRLILKRPLTEKLENRINATGFIALMALFVLITIIDIDRFIL